jgi:Tol biopolymer transport system component
MSLGERQADLSGLSLSHYRIGRRLGSGAMGVVYEAEDLRLERSVALKFIAPLGEITELDRRRFWQEARAVAALDHPNITTIFEIDEADGLTFIAMARVHGESVRDRLKNGPLAVDAALDLAIDIAKGLRAAHERGVLHRDIKPSNLLLTGDGVAQISDFGLARLPERSRLTKTGTALGTLYYMSPEQVRGEPLDERTDLWSLGVVLYESLTGARPFDGEYEQAVAFAIQNEEPPPIGSLRPETPALLEEIVAKTLAKNRRDRYPDAATLLRDLKALAFQVSSGRYAKYQDWYFATRGGKRLLRSAVVVLAIIALFTVWQLWQRRGGIDPLPPFHPRQITSEAAWEGEPAISPDGNLIAYASDREGACDLYVVDARGGRPVQVTADDASDRNPAWCVDGRSLLFESDRSGIQGIWKIGYMGGSARLVLAGAGEPAVSPDGRWLAFSSPDSLGRTRVGVMAMDTPSRQIILTEEGDGYWHHKSPAWSPDGRWICYGSFHNLWLVEPAAADPQPIQLTDGGRGDGTPTWSADGAFVYFSSSRENTTALWRVRADGEDLRRLTAGSGPESHPSLSKDGSVLCYSTERRDYDLVVENRRTGSAVRLRGAHDDDTPSLARDGSLVAFLSDREGSENQVWVLDLTDGVPAGEPRQVTDLAGRVGHPALSPDGRWLAYYRIVDDERDIWLSAVDGGSLSRITEHPESDIHPAWSPDGRWLAFASKRSGYSAIWIIPIADGQPAGAPRRLTGPDLGAFTPVWSPDGGTIAYRGVRGTESTVCVVPVDGSAVGACRVTSAVFVHRLRWNEATGELWVAADWGGAGPEIRAIAATGGADRPLEPPLVFPQGQNVVDFDLSADGQIVALTRQTHVGNVWVLQARNAAF